jgi:predicted lipoprotein with Yx(FWY)xxD motif
MTIMIMRAGAGAVLLIAGLAAAHAASAPPPTTPPGVTIVEVVREVNASQPQILWLRPGDANGRTLLTHVKDDARTAACVGECALEFPPLLAPRGARASGDWTLVKREGRKLQWAYQGKPLYTWTKEAEPGEVATNVGLQETANIKSAENVLTPTSLFPPEGWSVARFTPAASMALPDGIDARMLYAYESVVLTDFRGYTLYTFDGDAATDKQVCAASGCKIAWAPLAASALALPVGDFTIVRRADGARQWAYRERPLYVYSGDALPGDALGAGVDARWSVAVLTRNFTPPAVAIKRFEGYGDTFTVNDMTLYGGYAFGKRWGGRNLRDTFKDSYPKGKRLGGSACKGECLSKWKPFLADAKAQSGGFWEPIARPDGSRQWAYKGFAMYTFAGDTAPGQHRGQAVYDFKKPEGDANHLQEVAFLEEVGKAVAAAGVYWNIAKP